MKRELVGMERGGCCVCLSLSLTVGVCLTQLKLTEALKVCTRTPAARTYTQADRNHFGGMRQHVMCPLDLETLRSLTSLSLSSSVCVCVS